MSIAVREKLGTSKILDALRVKFAPPAYALLTEVADATGARHSRWADALIMSLWPSRGLELYGVEVKASRADWKKELDNPAKAEAICKFCDRWYLVVGDAAIVKPGELPATWGLMVPDTKGGLKIKTEAPKLEAAPVTRMFLAAIFRRSAEQSVDEGLISAAESRGFKNGKETSDTINEQLRKHDGKELEALKKDVAEFEDAAGIQIRDYFNYRGPAKIGAAVRQILNGDVERIVSTLPNVREQLVRVIAEIDAQCEQKGGA